MSSTAADSGHPSDELSEDHGIMPSTSTDGGHPPSELPKEQSDKSLEYSYHGKFKECPPPYEPVKILFNRSHIHDYYLVRNKPKVAEGSTGNVYYGKSILSENKVIMKVVQKKKVFNITRVTYTCIFYF